MQPGMTRAFGAAEEYNLIGKGVRPMTLDFPELLIALLTMVLFWIFMHDWIPRHRGPHH